MGCMVRVAPSHQQHQRPLRRKSPITRGIKIGIHAFLRCKRAARAQRNVVQFPIILCNAIQLVPLCARACGGKPARHACAVAQCFVYAGGWMCAECRLAKQLVSSNYIRYSICKLMPASYALAMHTNTTAHSTSDRRTHCAVLPSNCYARRI